MGLFDKVKAGVKNIDSKLGEEYDEVGIRKKIYDQNSKMKECYSKLGELYFNERNNSEKSDEMKKICEDIEQCQATIKGLEEKLAKIKEEGKIEREKNRNES